jgi:glycine hydroxymethyltransferase
MSLLKKADPRVHAIVLAETKRQEEGLEMIASENYVSEAVLEAQGSVLTNKYAEGYPGKRYYGGCEEVDKVEALAIERIKALFGAEHANVQPHSGSQANTAVYMACAPARVTPSWGSDLSHGGHLTHGHPAQFLRPNTSRSFPTACAKTPNRAHYDQMEALLAKALEHSAPAHDRDRRFQLTRAHH